MNTLGAVVAVSRLLTRLVGTTLKLGESKESGRVRVQITHQYLSQLKTQDKEL